MAKQIIVTVAREYGSGGRRVAEIIAKELGIKLYTRGMLEEIARELSVKEEDLEKYDEKPTNFFLTRRVGKYTNSMEEILVEEQFEHIKKKAASGESFVLVGRCGNAILKDNENVTSIFVTGDTEAKIQRIMETQHVSREEAKDAMEHQDRYRKKYTNSHTDMKWGDSRYYDICVNSSCLGIEGTAEQLLNFIKARME